MLSMIFPFVLYLHMLQLEEYKIGRFLSWTYHNYLTRTDTGKKPLVWTPKAKSIFYLAIFYAITTNFILLIRFSYLAILPCIVLLTQAYVFIIAGVITRKPYEILNKKRRQSATQNKIRTLKQEKLKVIGITGSYGKTSVKEFLYEMLKTKYTVLRTPESYNTLFGVMNVVDYELDDHYDYFICEMGAYKIGEIKELCETVFPDHAIVTGINEQHLERFLRIENTIKAKFELVEYADQGGLAVINGNNPYINEHYSAYRKDAIRYGDPSSGFSLNNIKTTETGTTFDIFLKGKKHTAKTRLVGPSNLENILASATMASALGVDPALILKTIRNLKPIPHRLEITTWQNSIMVIDNSYSSNVTGFQAALDLLNTFTKRKKVIATPGIVELGGKTFEIHKHLGKKIDEVCDAILLVGKNERTDAIADGVTNKSKIVFINSLRELSGLIDDPDESIVLIENDLPDNY